MDRELAGAESAAVGTRVREELARRRLSRQALADAARISLSTLEKALAGTRPFTLATTIRMEEALGIPLRTAATAAAAPALAPESMGAYARAAVRWIEGRYLTLRPSFGESGGVFAYVTDIAWDESAGHLVFAESQRVDSAFAQDGFVSMPSLSGHTYLVTNEAGQYRLIVLARPTIGGTLFGVLTTLQVGHGSQLVPVACPIALAKLAEGEMPATGLVAADAPDHARYAAILAQATGSDFARFPGAATR